MDLIQVPGKRNGKVPILVMPDVGKAMQLLATTRDCCSVPQYSKFFFATKSKDGYVNTWVVLHNTAVSAGLSHPRLVTSCRLRKHEATVAQLVNVHSVILCFYL